MSTTKSERPHPPPRARRGIEGVLDWIEEAELVNRRWARDSLVVFLTLVLLFLLAVRLGWLTP
jgi:hypothetical protein